VLGRLGLVQVLHELDEPPSMGILLALAGALILQGNVHRGHQEGQFAQPSGQDLRLDGDIGKDLGAGPETHRGPAMLTLAHLSQWGLGSAIAIGLVIQRSTTSNGQFQSRRQGIDHRDPYAMQAARDLIHLVFELAASMEHCHDHLGGRATFLGMDIHGDTPAIVGHGYRTVSANDDCDGAAEARQRLIDGIVHHLEHHVMQARAIISISDVHPGTLADCFEAT